MKLTAEQIKLYNKHKHLYQQLQEFVKTDLFKAFEEHITKQLSKANSLRDIDITADEEKLKTEIIYKKAKIEAYTKIIKFMSSLENLGKISEKELKKLEGE